MGGQGEREFETRFVWDHGGKEVFLCIFKNSTNITLPMSKNSEGYYEVETMLGQGRFEYCFSVDGRWTHDPDLPALRNSFGHFSNMIKIVDPKRVIESKVARPDNIARTASTSYSLPLEKCFSDLSLYETFNNEAIVYLTDPIIFQDDEGSSTDEDNFPDLDDAVPINQFETLRQTFATTLKEDTDAGIIINAHINKPQSKAEVEISDIINPLIKTGQSLLEPSISSETKDQINGQSFTTQQTQEDRCVSTSTETSITTVNNPDGYETLPAHTSLNVKETGEMTNKISMSHLPTCTETVDPSNEKNKPSNVSDHTGNNQIQEEIFNNVAEGTFINVEQSNIGFTVSKVEKYSEDQPPHKFLENTLSTELNQSTGIQNKDKPSENNQDKTHSNSIASRNYISPEEQNHIDNLSDTKETELHQNLDTLVRVTVPQTNSTSTINVVIERKQFINVTDCPKHDEEETFMEKTNQNESREKENINIIDVIDVDIKEGKILQSEKLIIGSQDQHSKTETPDHAECEITKSENVSIIVSNNENKSEKIIILKNTDVDLESTESVRDVIDVLQVDSRDAPTFNPDYTDFNQSDAMLEMINTKDQDCIVHSYNTDNDAVNSKNYKTFIEAEDEIETENETSKVCFTQDLTDFDIMKKEDLHMSVNSCTTLNESDAADSELKDNNPKESQVNHLLKTEFKLEDFPQHLEVESIFINELNLKKNTEFNDIEEKFKDDTEPILEETRINIEISDPIIHSIVEEKDVFITAIKKGNENKLECKSQNKINLETTKLQNYVNHKIKNSNFENLEKDNKVDMNNINNSSSSFVQHFNPLECNTNKCTINLNGSKPLYDEFNNNIREHLEEEKSLSAQQNMTDSAINVQETILTMSDSKFDLTKNGNKISSFIACPLKAEPKISVMKESNETMNFTKIEDNKTVDRNIYMSKEKEIHISEADSVNCLRESELNNLNRFDQDQRFENTVEYNAKQSNSLEDGSAYQFVGKSLEVLNHKIPNAFNANITLKVVDNNAEKNEEVCSSIQNQDTVNLKERLNKDSIKHEASINEVMDELKISSLSNTQELKSSKKESNINLVDINRAEVVITDETGIDSQNTDTNTNEEFINFPDNSNSFECIEKENTIEIIIAIEEDKNNLIQENKNSQEESCMNMTKSIKDAKSDKIEPFLVNVDDENEKNKKFGIPTQTESEINKINLQKKDILGNEHVRKEKHSFIENTSEEKIVEKDVVDSLSSQISIIFDGKDSFDPILYDVNNVDSYISSTDKVKIVEEKLVSPNQEEANTAKELGVLEEHQNDRNKNVVLRDLESDLKLDSTIENSSNVPKMTNENVIQTDLNSSPSSNSCSNSSLATLEKDYVRYEKVTSLETEKTPIFFNQANINNVPEDCEKSIDCKKDDFSSKRNIKTEDEMETINLKEITTYSDSTKDNKIIESVKQIKATHDLEDKCNQSCGEEKYQNKIEKPVHNVPQEKVRIKVSGPENEVRETKKLRPGDIFSQIKNTVVSIARSKSRSELRLGFGSDLLKSPSKTVISEPIAEDKDDKEKLGFPHREKEKSKEKSKDTILVEQEPVLMQSPLIKKRQNEVERDRVQMKLDAIFAPIRSESVDDMRTEIRIRGMGDIKLKPQVIKKSMYDHNKMDQELEKKRMMQKQVSMPEKPTKYKKLKAKDLPKESTPPLKEPTPIEEPSEIEEEASSIIEEIMKEEEDIPPFSPELPKPQTLPDITDSIRLVATEPVLPPKLGINGLDHMGRLILRSAIESGFDIIAVNDAFIPVHHMVHALKYDMSHSLWKGNKRELSIKEGTQGHIIINGKDVVVFSERDSSKVPWDTVGVNCVIETIEAFNTFNAAKLHLRSCQQKEEKGELPVHEYNSEQLYTGVQEYNSEQLYTGVQRVIIANPSPDVKCMTIGVSSVEDIKRCKITTHASAPVTALAVILKILDEKFGVEFCSYSLMKAVMNSRGDIKCPNLGPSSHARSVKWDFKENLVPCEAPELEQGVIKALPNMKGKLTGLVVYTPIPEVSMLDLTVGLTAQSDCIYRDVCVEVKARSQTSHRGIIKYVMKMSDENSASCVYSGTSESIVFDAKSGNQVNDRTIKLLLWFDSEAAFASRTVDLIKMFFNGR